MTLILLLLSLLVSLQMVDVHLSGWINLIYFALTLLAACGYVSAEAREFARVVLTIVGALVFVFLLAASFHDVGIL